MKRRLLTLFYEPELDALSPINFGPEFQEESPLQRMDLMGDALEAITQAYEDAVRTWQASEKWRGDRDVQ